MNCPCCASAMAVVGDSGVFHCARCDGHVAPATEDAIVVIGEPVGASCPVCMAPLVSAQVESETVAVCGKCNGFMAEMDAFRVIVARRRLHHTASEKSTDPLD